jgi:MFS family permease
MTSSSESTMSKKGSDSESALELKDFVLGEDGLLTFHQDSLLKPGNWEFRKKILHTILYGLVTFCAQFNSTTLSPSRFTELMAEGYGTSREVAMLSSSLYILGIAFGPMVFAPISEVYGRKIGVLVPFLLSSVFAFACATSYNVPALLIYRFLSGFFCGAPIVSAGGVLADIFPNPSIRGKYFALYAMFVSLGPSCGPVISSLLMYSRPSTDLGAWRIPEYFSGLINLTLFFICQIVLEETYPPMVLQRRARLLRLDTGNYNIHCSHDMWKLEFRDVMRNHLVRPFAMLFTPIVMVIVLFASYVFGVFYLFITTLPEVMYLSRGWTGTVATLPNMALFCGTFSGCIVNMMYAKRYARKIEQNNGVVIPEERFPLVMAIGWLMPAGIFICSWTSTKDIHWFASCIGIYCLGLGFLTIFQGCLNYLVDTYTKYSASAIACNTFLRSIFAAGFPLFSKQLFVNLGVHWGGSLLGFIALGMIPIPFIFYKFGAAIRAKRPYKGA